MESPRNLMRAKFEHDDSNPSGDPDFSADGDSSSKQEEQNLENMPVEYYPTEVEIDKVAMTRYYKQLRESDGFDVDPLPRPTLLGPRICGGHVPITPPIPVRIRKILQDCSEEAIKFYNERENTNYKYDDLVKANVRGAAVAMYFITFQATDPSDQSSVIFQAQVWRTVELKYEVILCRIKPTQ